MIKKLLRNLFGSSKRKPVAFYIEARLNDKIMPIFRGEVYEDPLDEFLKANFYGEVTGGGTQLDINNEIAFCDLKIKLNTQPTDQVIKEIIDVLELLGAPKGSKIILASGNKEIPFGKLEGLGLYLDGVNLSDEVYKNSDSEALATDIIRLADIKSDVIRFSEGNTETALFFYGESFENIKDSITDYINNVPDCEGCRIVQIA